MKLHILTLALILSSLSINKGFAKEKPCKFNSQVKLLENTKPKQVYSNHPIIRQKHKQQKGNK